MCEDLIKMKNCRTQDIIYLRMPFFAFFRVKKKSHLLTVSKNFESDRSLGPNKIRGIVQKKTSLRERLPDSMGLEV